ncbi:MAG: prepilin-type N-terminal cleavage/methylation domain-containing protein [Pseudomonadota bacterium]
MTRPNDETAHKRRSQSGLSLIEVLSAVAIFSIAFLPLLDLQRRMAATAQAIERAERSAFLRTNALEEFASINPALTNAGEAPFKDGLLLWRATPTSEPKRVMSSAGLPSRFEITLYRIDATLEFEGGRRESFSVYRYGWKPVRPYSID